MEQFFLSSLEHSWTTKASATTATTETTTRTTAKASTAPVRTTRASEALTTSLATKQVETVDDVNHTLAGDSVVLGIATHHS